MRLISRIPRALRMGAVALLVTSLAGCLTDSKNEEPEPGDPEFPGRDTVTNAVQHYAAAWEKKSLTELSALLHENYEFCPRPEDVDDFPWLTGECWSRADELAIAANMFDPNFQATQQAYPVKTITLDVLVQSERQLDQATQRHEVVAVVQGQILMEGSSGFSFDTRIIFELVPDSDEAGLWQIINQREISRT